MKHAIDDGAPVIDYCHLLLADNIGWIFVFWPGVGLASFYPVTFERKAKPSAIAKANAPA